ncbi:hypothetical protein QFZ75_000105 [Streptomyces sp. V3I8]|uniref:hypothetical protein n=1 Tax=Streptomyces sp. V3I8 TaxID=3042279 RepID=UPI00278109E9|nr:hypothetical protein [Streptomyces sp. V3I8]MDQ1033689.1 hypothetical protein [Streptomyces sp. V3I8]
MRERYEDMLDDGLDAVFVEKPLGISVDDCDTLLTAALRSRTRLYAGHNLRRLPVLRRMREPIDDPTGRRSARRPGPTLTRACGRGGTGRYDGADPVGRQTVTSGVAS